MSPPASKLFRACKAVGLITGDKKMALRYIEKQRKFILKVPVGNSFHIYAANNLSLMSVSEFHDSEVSCIVSGKHLDYTGTKSGMIHQWTVFSTMKNKFKGHDCEVKHLLPIGDGFLVSIDISNTMKVWNPSNCSLISNHALSKSSFEISVIIHPHTYVNKVLLGSKQGEMRLMNIRTSALLYSFPGWEAGVSALLHLPVISGKDDKGGEEVDIVAVGLEDGRIILHNIKYDQTLCTLKQDWGMVTSLSFRTDNNNLLVSGSASGQIGLWELKEEDGKVKAVLTASVEQAHNGPIISLLCAHGEPVVYTSSSDNVLKAYAFDIDSGARQLCIRDGHSEPPLKVRFHGADGTLLLSGGIDSNLRSSCLPTMKGRSLGLACYNRELVKKRGLKSAKKMPPIVHFTSDLTKEEVWDNVAAIHLDTTFVTTWSVHKGKMNNEFLKHQRFSKLKYEKAVATCISISKCGNFVFVGYDTGHLEKFNIQSVQHKFSYEQQSCAIRGVVTDSQNLWTVAGLQDGTIHWFSFLTGDLLTSLNLESGIQLMTINTESGLFAVSLDDWSLFIIDIKNKVITRKLEGHHNQVTDLAISSDSKWLISSSMDHTIRTWDMTNGYCIDSFSVPSPATSIAFSPIDQYLVTTHVGELGLYVWTNRCVCDIVNLQPLKDSHTPKMLYLPCSSPDDDHKNDDDSHDDSESNIDDLDDQNYVSPAQLPENYVTIDLMPTSRWLTLQKIDDIKKRNKPTEGPKVLKSAPFFLETAEGITSLTDENADDSKSKFRESSLNIMESLSPFGKLLKAGEYDEAFALLHKKGPSYVDLEIRNLDPDMGGSNEVMTQFLNMIIHMIQRNVHFEVAQGYLALFMKRHSEFVSRPENEICHELIAYKYSSSSLADDLNTSLCLLSFVKNSAILNF